MPISAKEEEFVKYRDFLQYEVSRLGSYLALYQKLYERRTDRLKEMNIAPAFFQVVWGALFAAIILWVDKLCDEKSERGVFDFLRFIEKNMDLFTIEELRRRITEDHEPDETWMRNQDPITLETINEDRTQIRSLECLQSFAARRDKFYAHFDREYFFDRERLDNEAPLTWEELKQPFGLVSEIVNRYSIAFDGREFGMTPCNINDVDYLLECLHKYRTQMQGQ
jgi:hypothetical protein